MISARLRRSENPRRWILPNGEDFARGKLAVNRRAAVHSRYVFPAQIFWDKVVALALIDYTYRESTHHDLAGPVCCSSGQSARTRRPPCSLLLLLAGLNVERLSRVGVYVAHRKRDRLLSPSCK